MKLKKIMRNLKNKKSYYYTMSSVSHENSGLMSSMIYLNTRSTNIRKVYGDYSEIIFYFAGNISVPEGFVFLVSVADAVIPVSWYIISEFNNNNSFDYSINDISYNYIIPDGNYTVTELQEILIDNVPFTISYNSINNKFTFSHSTNEFILLSTSTCFELIGFTENINHSSTSKILIGDNQVDLAGTRNVYICTNLQTLNMDSRVGTVSSHILTKIPVNVNNNNLITYYNYNGFRSLLRNRLINNIRIRIEDDKGNLININNHYSISIDLHIIPDKLLMFSNQLTL